MNIILLSGGSGKRLWPLSNNIRSKQFIKIFKKADGSHESMAQRVYGQIKKVNPDAVVTVATGKQQKSAVFNQLGSKVGVCVEPSRRDTFPAIALAAAYMQSERGLKPDDVIIVCPVDPYVETDYFVTLQRLEDVVKEKGANLTLMGVTPTYPSQKYGYIIPEKSDAPVKKVSCFREKPDVPTAEKYIADGALWNCGVFAFKLGYLLKVLHRYMEFDCYADVYANYEKLPKISFDYAVVEKESSVNCIEFDGEWKDVGTWNTFTEVMSESALGNAVIGSKCENVSIVNEMDVPILAMGCKNMVIAAGPDGVLVSDKVESAQIKPYVDNLTQRVMYEEKSWGEFKVLSVEEHAMTIKLNVLAGRSMSYHCHKERDEVWTVLSGHGVVTLGDTEQNVAVGSVIKMSAGVQHTLTALSDMELIEIQLGNKIMDSDKVKETQAR